MSSLLRRTAEPIGRPLARTCQSKIVRRLLLVLLLVFVLKTWVAAPVIITGDSMSPALHSGQLAVVNKLAYAFRQPRRGDVVLIWTDSGFMAKRILALPGETVALRRGRVFINGEPVDEPYALADPLQDVSEGELTPDCFATSGDNRSNSIVAVVARERIVGKLAYATAAKSTNDRNGPGF